MIDHNSSYWAPRDPRFEPDRPQAAAIAPQFAAPVTDGPIPPARAARRSRAVLLIAALVVLLVATAAVAAVVGYRQGMAASDRNHAAVAQAAAAQSPNLSELAEAHFGTNSAVSGEADYLEITITDGDAATMGAKLVGFLDDLGFSHAVVERMTKTRALDGTQTAEGKNCNVSWTYHPDHGLQMVFEAKATG
ncbi:hypothetical protein [Nakamurella lactea]|uniref:hypothetical protein n=1 Tax=Nakamurella lactea TaxID=459515 RepID=UPI0003F51EC5|nr:hypothetical protein [Nakamurella lactea]